MTVGQKPITSQFLVRNTDRKSAAMSLSTNPLDRSETAIDFRLAKRHIRGLATAFFVLAIAAFLAYLCVTGHAFLSFWIAVSIFGLMFMAGVSKLSSNPDQDVE
jgi:hypothetical protein